jgi:drug/metabolite transporter (DMT)-like permease
LQTDTSARSRSIRSTLLLTLTAFIWGMAFVAQRVGMEFIGPFLFAGIRMVLGAATLLAVLALSTLVRRLSRRLSSANDNVQTSNAIDGEKTAGLSSRQVPLRSLLRPGILCGVVIFLAGCTQQVGLVFTFASKAGFLTTLYIVLVPILGIALRQKTHWNTWVSVLIAVVGLYLLCMNGGFFIQFGDLIVLVSALFWACHILVIDHSVVGLDRQGVMVLCVLQFCVAAVLSLLCAPFFDGFFATGSFSLGALTDAMPSLLYTGVLSTGVAFTLQAVGQQGLKPSAAAIIMSLEAVFSVLGGVLILGEVLSGRELLGCAAMFIAVTLSQLPVPAIKGPRGSKPT